MLNLLVHDDMLLKPSRLNFSRPGELFDMDISCSKASRTTARHTATVSGRWDRGWTAASVRAWQATRLPAFIARH